MRKNVFLLIVFLSVCVTAVFAGGKNFCDDDTWILQQLNRKQYALDPDAAAVVLYEKRSSEVRPDNNYMVRHTIRRIIKILRKDGLKFADVSVATFRSDNHFAEIKKISGTTYNLEQGGLGRQELGKVNISNEKESYLVRAKFSMPSVREGSVIDYSYTIDEDFSFLFSEWTFQSLVPTLYSELEVWTPSHLEVTSVTQGSLAFIDWNIRKKIADSLMPESYQITEVGDGNLFTRRCWVRRDVPALEEEPYVSNLDNYSEKIQLQITGVEASNFKKTFMDTWEKVNTALYESFSFYRQLETVHQPVRDKTNELTAGITDKLEKAKAVFAYVRKHVNRHGESGLYAADPEKAFASGSGTGTDINMLLIVMLKYAGLTAEPVLVCTKDHGRAIDNFPLVQRFNHVVCEFKNGSDTYYLDASGRYNRFGVLPDNCYNGYSRVVNKKGYAIDLSPAQCLEKGMISITTVNADIKDYQLGVSQYFGNTSATELREQWNADTTLIKKYILEQLRKLPFEARLKSYNVQQLDNPESALNLTYNFSVSWEGNTVYMPLMFMNWFPGNPFKAAGRSHPVEMPSLYDYTYALQLQLPKEFTVSELPKSEVVTMDDKDEYKYMVSYDNGTNMIRGNIRTQLLRSKYPSENYTLLKAFFDKMVALQQRNCVIKRI